MNPETLERLNRANQQLIDSINALEKQDALTTTGMSLGTAIAALIVALSVMLVCAPFGAWIAAQRGRSKWEGALLAGFFGPMGMLIEALLPEKRTHYHRPTSVDAPWRQWEPDSNDAPQAMAKNDDQDELMEWLNR